MEKTLRRYGKSYPLGCFLLILFLLLSHFSYAQGPGNQENSYLISGTVTDEAGTPLIGATILLKDAPGIGTSTDENGKFSIKASEGDVLVASILGYEEKEIVIKNASPIIFTLEEAINLMDEAVVIGYGTVSKRDLTGSVSGVTGNQLERRFFVSPEQMLQGMVAGVQVVETSAEPGSTVSIRIRGTNSINSDNEPLYVVDGYVGASIDGINTNDIQSMEVLKDASATAIYGSRGANGVILITTKQGRAGKPVITYDLKYGVSKVAKKIEMANAYEYSQYLMKNKSADLLLWKTEEEWANIGEGTDWQDEIFQLGQYQNHQLSIRGGAQKTTYSVSGSIMDQKGNVINSNLTKMTLRTSLSQGIGSRIKFTLNTNIARSKGNRATVNSAGTPQDGATVLNALRMAPFVSVYDEDGNYNMINDFPGNGESGGGKTITLIGNPVAYANLVRNSISSLSGSVNGIVTVDILPGLQWKSTVGTAFSRVENSEYIPKSTYEGSLKGGQSTDAKNTSGNVLTEHTLSYDKRIKNKHKINAVLGFTYQKFNSSAFSMVAREYFSDINNGYDISNASAITDYSSSLMENSIMSYLGRVNYSYDSRYVVTVTGRADGSSKFAAGHRWGYFPAVALAWNVNQEKFMSRATWLDELKVRASYGISGNQEIGNFKSMYFHNTGQYQFNTSDKVISLTPAQLGNKELEWEKTLSYNIGLDFTAFNNRLTLNADVYYKKTYDMLSEKRVPESSGFRTVMVNIGDVQNKGLELSLLSRNIVSKEEGGFYWETRINYAMNKNKILRLGENNEDLYVGTSSGNLSSVGTTSILRVGEPIGAFFGCIYDGVWRDQSEIDEAVANGWKDSTKPGDPKFIDQNGDGYINEDDRVINGYAYPEFTLSMNNSFSYKNFTLDIFVYGSFGNSVFNLNRYYMESFSQYNKPMYYINNMWTESNPDGIYPRSNTPKMRQTPGAVSLYVEDASFIRIKNITLGYSFPSRLLSKTFIKNLRIYVTGDNLFTFTNYTGYDPEVNSFGKSNTDLATDRGAYPKYRSVIAGLTIGF